MKILLVTEVIAGNGHHKAAESLLKEIKRRNPEHEVKIVHLLEVWSKSIAQWAQKIYLSIILKRPKVWAWAYRKESNFAFVFKQIIAYLMYIKLDRFLKKEKPDLIIATHASGLTALSKLKKRYHFKLAAVFTDYHINNFWIQNNMDYYFVGHEELKRRLIEQFSLDPNQIINSGIPIDPVFNDLYFQERNQEDHYFRILVMGGGLGIGSIQEIVNSFKNVGHVSVSVYVVTGRNKKLYQELTDLAPLLPFPIEVFSYVEELYPMMKSSHLVITKPGGLTISEALSASIPILIVQPIPGQEEYNARFLIRNRSAIRIQNIAEIPYWVEYLYQHPGLYKKIQAHQTKIARPNSSSVIIESLLKSVVQCYTK
ncbi:MGDG synthase family glycosyltransferase [Tepidibacillus marianensis]|uniref:MGDG synthase family glycosyltransferase n=1 Tax=Tepidibacillus marianensis TaxID=3131995 RepID=UPI0030D4F14F